MRLETPAEVRREHNRFPQIWFRGEVLRAISGVDFGVEYDAETTWEADEYPRHYRLATYSVNLTPKG